MQRNLNLITDSILNSDEPFESPVDVMSDDERDSYLDDLLSEFYFLTKNL